MYNRTVPYHFPVWSRFNGIFIVGEAPGAEEDKLGLPFIGRAGKVLTKIIRDSGISNRYDCIISNVFRCRPDNNNINEYFSYHLRDKSDSETLCYDVPKFKRRMYLLQRHKRHLNYLYRTIKVWKPAVIVPLGTTALWALLPELEKISECRGNIYESDKFIHSSILPTFHPSYVLRNISKLYDTVVEDFKTAKRLAINFTPQSKPVISSRVLENVR